MIVYDLACHSGHRFEGWFGSAADFDTQNDRGLVSCPECGSQEITKAPMAPAVPAKSNQNKAARQTDKSKQAVSTPSVALGPIPAEMQKAIEALSKAQTQALESSKWVGKEFVEKSRAMHYGETDREGIHGEASAKEAKELVEEGVPIAPLLFPVAPPKDLN